MPCFNTKTKHTQKNQQCFGHGVLRFYDDDAAAGVCVGVGVGGVGDVVRC